jgi:hypothetical protein
MTEKEKQYIRAAGRISIVRSELENSDYKIIKCYEASLTGAPMPYDLQALVASREALRQKIREYEAILSNKK